MMRPQKMLPSTSSHAIFLRSRGQIRLESCDWGKQCRVRIFGRSWPRNLYNLSKLTLRTSAHKAITRGFRAWPKKKCNFLLPTIATQHSLHIHGKNRCQAVNSTLQSPFAAQFLQNKHCERSCDIYGGRFGRSNDRAWEWNNTLFYLYRVKSINILLGPHANGENVLLVYLCLYPIFHVLFSIFR